MNPKKRRRLAFVVAIVLAGAGAAGFIIATLGKNVRYFYSPSDLAAERVAPGIAIRVGGLVEKKSVRHDGGVSVHFTITDGSHTVPVAYTGGLPGLFREGQGVVATGALDRNGMFDATELLAKHDEKYTPPEVVDALKRSGHWKDGA
jgi:cytochrome c-type biogenesis protein CcmE